MSLNVLRNCSSLWTNQLTKLIVCPLSTSSAVQAKTQFHLPMRDYMVENQRLRQRIDAQRRRMRISEDEKREIFFENRNPRHMELMGYNKPTGFPTLYERRNFYNKLHLEITNRHIKTYVENINGQIVCYASTTEHAIAKRLHRPTHVASVVNVARVLAERLKKAGLLRVQFQVRYPRTTEKVIEFEGVLRNSGIILAELPRKCLVGRPASLPPKRQKRVIHSGKLCRRAKNKGTKPPKPLRSKLY
jgi:hypothetical protein